MGDIRQGDVYLRRLSRFARLGKVVRRHDNIVAAGEQTGHNHRLVGSGQVLESGQGRRFVVVLADETPTELTHEDHGVQTVEPGKWEVHEQRQYVSEREADYIRD